jgi:hypothetical protein
MKKWTQQDTTAHRGIAKIYRVVTDMGYIWRPTANSDVGLDGEIELVEDRAAKRSDFLDQHCSSDAALRQELQRLLRAEEAKMRTAEASRLCVP